MTEPLGRGMVGPRATPPARRRGPILLVFACACLAACGGGASTEPEHPAGGGAGADEGGGAGGEQPAEPRAEVGEQLLGQWRERLPEEDARVLELMRMAVEHPDWRRRDVARQDLPPDDAANLQSFLAIMRIDPEAKERMRKAVDNAGMRARFTEDSVFLGRDEMQDVEVPYEIVGIEEQTVEIVLEGAEGEEPTEIVLVDEDTFEAPWGGGGAVLTFDKRE